MHLDADRTKLGELYRHTDIKYGDNAQITFLDQRNLLSILSYFIKHIRKRNIGLFNGLCSFFLNMKLNAVFINGKYLKDLENYDKLIVEELQREGEVS